ncbi:MAG: hypothetical protein ACOCYE_02075 [Pseudomonadota bacterium]
MPHTFTDAADRMWTIPMTVGSIRRVENALGYNLANAAEPAEEGESPLLTRLAIDPALLVDVVYVLVQPQAEKQGVDDLQFGEAIDGDAYGRLSEAFWGALTDFFLGVGRSDTVRAIERQTQILKDATQKAGDRIDRLEIDVDAALDASARGASALKSPADSA